MTWNWKFPEYGKNWEEIAEACKMRDSYKCRVCGAHGNRANPPGTAHLQACHIVSKRRGGRDILSNLRTLCLKCHSQESGHDHMRANPEYKKLIKKQSKKWNF